MMFRHPSLRFFGLLLLSRCHYQAYTPRLHLPQNQLPASVPKKKGRIFPRRQKQGKTKNILSGIASNPFFYFLVSLTKTLNKFLETTIPVNKLIPIPKAKVIAKPRTGPEVCRNAKSKGFAKTKVVAKVAIFASRMDSQARPNETSKASIKGRC